MIINLITNITKNILGKRLINTFDWWKAGLKILE